MGTKGRASSWNTCPVGRWPIGLMWLVGCRRARLCSWGGQVVSALAAAHEAGVVHRDVNPANLLVSSFGHVKVGDFGIAGLVRGSGLMTRIHALTLAYASPEELDGEAEVGTAADVFSLAATLSHLSSGERPSFSRRGEFTAPWGGDSRLIDLTAVMGACLATKPADRPTVLELTRVFDRTTLRLGDERIDRLSDVEGKTIVRPRQVVDRGSPSSPSAHRNRWSRARPTPRMMARPPIPKAGAVVSGSWLSARLQRPASRWWLTLVTRDKGSGGSPAAAASTARISVNGKDRQWEASCDQSPSCIEPRRRAAVSIAF